MIWIIVASLTYLAGGFLTARVFVTMFKVTDGEDAVLAFLCFIFWPAAIWPLMYACLDNLNSTDLSKIFDKLFHVKRGK